jgi:hypothetical protein
MEINLDDLYPLLTPRPGRTRQASSLGRDPDRGGTWCGLRPAPARGKRILLEPGETHAMASLQGAGLITRLWMTTLLPFNPNVLRDLVLRFYWDGEAQPSVESPLGDFFGAPFGRYASYVAAPLSLTSGAFNCLWPMPYASAARLEVTNEGSRSVDPLFYQVTYYELEAPPQGGELRFHAQWRRENPTLPGVPYTVLEAEGSGHYVGCHMFMQNLEWWLRPPLGAILFPRGFGIGMLEGWESQIIDGEGASPVVGTGTEDYFGGSWYFQREKFAAPYHGCTVRDYVRGRIAAYRFDVRAPVPFRRSFRMTLDHGFENQMRCDYASVAYWYQTEPHRPFPPLPRPVACRPTSPLANVTQVGLVLVAPALLGLALVRGLRQRRAG